MRPFHITFLNFDFSGMIRRLGKPGPSFIHGKTSCLSQTSLFPQFLRKAVRGPGGARPTAQHLASSSWQTAQPCGLCVVTEAVPAFHQRGADLLTWATFSESEAASRLGSAPSLLPLGFAVCTQGAFVKACFSPQGPRGSGSEDDSP